MEIAIFGNRYQDDYTGHLKRFFNRLECEGKDLKLIIEERYMDYLRESLGADAPRCGTFAGNDFDAQLALSIGGDGTFLTTASIVGRKQTPIMGINSGHLGYLSAARITEADKVATVIARHLYTIDDRSMISVDAGPDIELPRRYALNEVAVMKQDTASMITVDAFVDGRELASYRADGLIVSTPTGSTGYNLSVGGPIVEPHTPVWTISPIAAHSLNMRPLVVSDHIAVELTAKSRSGSYLLSVDGQSLTLSTAHRLHLQRAPFVTKVVQPLNHNFIDTLRRKMLWGMDSI